MNDIAHNSSIPCPDIAAEEHVGGYCVVIKGTDSGAESLDLTLDSFTE